jgi:hypothetical protein
MHRGQFHNCYPPLNCRIGGNLSSSDLKQKTALLNGQLNAQDTHTSMDLVFILSQAPLQLLSGALPDSHKSNCPLPLFDQTLSTNYARFTLQVWKETYRCRVFTFILGLVCEMMNGNRV